MSYLMSGVSVVHDNVKVEVRCCSGLSVESISMGFSCSDGVGWSRRVVSLFAKLNGLFAVVGDGANHVWTVCSIRVTTISI
jgi:hypothetical protein